MSEAAKSHLFRRLWLRLFATVGIVAAVLLSWWWKVDGARAPDQVPVVAFGQPIQMGRTQLTPLSLRTRKVSDRSGELVLTATVENVTGESQIMIFGLPRHPPEITLKGEALPPPEMILLRDGTPLMQLQPRLPEQVEFIWSLPADWQSQEVAISFSRQIFKLRDNLYGQEKWLGFTPVARMAVTPGAAL